jgi:glycosyltransferase involved in cell wall biosynthesis
MLLSVIIPTYKRRETLTNCLKLLTPKVQNLPDDLFEVIVTDDADDGGTTDYLNKEFPGVRRNQGPQKGPASNRNSGAKAARGEWLLFLDDDCLPTAHFLSAYIDATKKHAEYRVFEGSTLPEGRRRRLDEEAPINDRGGYLWSCNFLVNRELFFEIGGFCERYPFACMEDVDFREQLKARGIEFLFTPDASVVHPWRPFAPDEKYLKMRLVSHAIFYERYPATKPTFVKTLRTAIRLWVLGLCVEAPSMFFRGFGRFLERQMTITKYLFASWSQGRRKNS